MQFEKSKDIPANGPYGLGEALYCAAKSGRKDVIKALSHPNLKKISPDGEFGLGAALREARTSGFEDAEEAFMGVLGWGRQQRKGTCS